MTVDDADVHDLVQRVVGFEREVRLWIAQQHPVLPLTAHVPMFPHGVGFVIRAERRGERWPVRVVSPVAIYDCVGARDEAAELQLRTLLHPEASARIQALSIEPHPKGRGCLLHMDGFCLQE